MYKKLNDLPSHNLKYRGKWVTPSAKSARNKMYSTRTHRKRKSRKYRPQGGKL